MTDAEILTAAIAASRLSADGFANDVLDVDARKVQAWLAGERPMLAGIRALCLLIVERPGLAEQLRQDRMAADKESRLS